jgi:FtsH-binding integral membrane protein
LRIFTNAFKLKDRKMKKGGNQFMKKGWGMASFILFCIGLVLAVVGGLMMPENAIIAMVLVVLGLIIGIIHVIHAKDATALHTLLLATIALLVMTAAFAPITLMGAGKMIGSMLVNFAALMAPVALIAAIKALLNIGLAK